MKTINYILLTFMALLYWQCNEEDPIDSALGSYHRDYDVNSPDTVMRFISQYYYKYGRVFITDPDSTDYMYNFQYKNSLYIEQPVQTTEHLLYGISKMKTLFMGAYPDKCLKEHFPNSLIISDSIKQTDYPYNNLDFYLGRNFIALNIGNMTKGYDSNQLKDLSLRMHIGFIKTHLYQYQGALELTDFFSPGETLYNTKTSKIWSEEEIWASGFLYDRESHEGSWGSDYSSFPSRLDDLDDYLAFMLGYQKKYSHVPTNVDELLATYPLIKQKYDALAKAIKETTGADFQDLIYKEQ